MSPDAPTDALLARLDALETRLATVEAENATLRARTTPAGAPVLAPAPVADAALDRRNLLRKGLAVAGAAAAGAVLLDGAPVAAANGGALVIGQGNDGSANTSLTHTGGSGYGLHVSSATVNAAAIRAAGSTSGGGLAVFGGKYHLAFERSGGRVPPIQDTVFHSRGEVVIDAYSNLWYCINDGTPGTWRTLAGNGSGLPGAGSFYPTPGPIRVYDSRPGTSPNVGSKTRLAANVTRTLDLKVNSSGLYAGVNTAVLNLLLVNASAGSGNVTVWAANQPKPLGNTLVWGGSAGRFSTLAYSLLDGAARVNVNASLATDLVVDVVGYYR